MLAVTQTKMLSFHKNILEISNVCLYIFFTNIDQASHANTVYKYLSKQTQNGPCQYTQSA